MRFFSWYMDATWQVYLREVQVVLVIDVSDTQTRRSFFCT